MYTMKCGGVDHRRLWGWYTADGGDGRGCKSTFVRKKLKILIIHVEKKSIDSQVHTISISYTIFRKITRLHNYSIHSENKHVYIQREDR